MPELQEQFKDKMLDVIAERFKLTSIAQSLSERGAHSVEEALKMIAELTPEAGRRWPNHAFLDGLYKLLGDRTLGRR